MGALCFYTPFIIVHIRSNKSTESERKQFNSFTLDPTYLQKEKKIQRVMAMSENYVLYSHGVNGMDSILKHNCMQKVINRIMHLVLSVIDLFCSIGAKSNNYVEIF